MWKAVVALAVAAAVTWQGARAAFTATTGTTGNSVSTATVTLTDDRTGDVFFNPTNLIPGSTGSHCVTVTYGGTAQATVRLSASAVSGGFAPYIDLTVEEGADCTGGPVVFDAALPTLAGAGTFAPTGPGQSRAYLILYTVDPAAPYAAAGTTATAVLTWQARST